MSPVLSPMWFLLTQCLGPPGDKDLVLDALQIYDVNICVYIPTYFNIRMSVVTWGLVSDI